LFPGMLIETAYTGSVTGLTVIEHNTLFRIFIFDLPNGEWCIRA